MHWCVYPSLALFRLRNSKTNQQTQQNNKRNQQAQHNLKPHVVKTVGLAKYQNIKMATRK